ncbi:uncharacterized protein [Mytilus edulis]|uniref:uncharacterized protein isoform X2 n=1 Tax=Mytilus edulis TaxID=6550 RepID=UPI0039EF8181
MFSHLKSLLGFETCEPEQNRPNHQINDGNPVFAYEFKREQLSKLENTETRDLKRKLVDVQFKLQDKDVMKNKELSAKKKGTTSLLLNKQIIRRVGPADELSKYNRPFVNTRSYRDVLRVERNSRNDSADGHIHRPQKMNVTLENSHYKSETDHNSLKMDAFNEDLQNQKVCISSSMLEDSQCFGTETELKVSHPVSNTCTKNDIDESVVDSQTQDVYTQNNPIFAVEDTENHRENSPNHSTCSSTISDVFPEEDQSNIQDIEQRSEGIANNTRTRLGSVESLRQIFEKKQESTETKGVSQTDTLATDFKEKLKLEGHD